MEILEVFAGIATVLSIISFVFAIVSFIATWRIFNKMGEPGWKCLIPFYGNWVMASHIFGSGWAMFILIIPVAGIPIFFSKLFMGFGMNTLPAVLLSIFAAPIGLLVYGFNSAEWLLGDDEYTFTQDTTPRSVPKYTYDEQQGMK